MPLTAPNKRDCEAQRDRDPCSSDPGRIALNVEIDVQRALHVIAAGRTDRDSRIGRHQRVDEVHTQLRKMAVRVGETMTAGAYRERRRTADSNRSDSSRHRRCIRKLTTIDSDRQTSAVDGERHGFHDAANVIVSFGVGDDPISIGIDQHRNLRGDVGTRRQTDLDLKTLPLDPESGRLQVLVETVRTGGCGRTGDDEDQAEQETKAWGHRVASFAP